MFEFNEHIVSAFSTFYFGVINVITFTAFGMDKRFSIRGGWRFPEKTLLLFAASGGTVGALIGQRYFRHKTQKQPFKGILYGIAMLQLGLLGFIMVNVLRIL